MSRQTVRRILAGTRDDVFRPRATTLDRWAERLNADWDAGCRNGAELWRRLRDAGYGGSQRVATEWATRRRRATKASSDRPYAVTTVLPARTIARLLTSDCKSAQALLVRVAIEATEGVSGYGPGEAMRLLIQCTALHHRPWTPGRWRVDVNLCLAATRGRATLPATTLVRQPRRIRPRAKTWPGSSSAPPSTPPRAAYACCG